MNLINGLHHITAIGRNAQLNYDFYTEVMGMRLVKRTVNFDDPHTYHLYYGDGEGTPGSILTFFPWPGMRRGHAGRGMIGETSLSVLVNSLTFWKNRFEEFKVHHQPFNHRFGEAMLPFEDREGLRLNLCFTRNFSSVKPCPKNEISEGNSVKGFRGISLILKEINPTAKVLTEILGYTFFGQEGNCYRYNTNAPGAISVIDLFEIPKVESGLTGAGTYHHVAFRVKNETELVSMRELILKYNLKVTEIIDRNYFYSIYFREPGGVLFEIATDSPGFSVDESIEELGNDLKLPARYEHDRKNIENILPELQIKKPQNEIGMLNEVLLKLNENGEGLFYIRDYREKIAHLDIKMIDKTLIAVHTEVNPAYEGKGLAKEMFLKMVSYARENQLKIKALCPYVNIRFKKNPEEYRDVLG